MSTEAWPVATSPATGHHDDSCPILHEPSDIDVDEVLAVIRRHLVWPAPIRDKALEEEPCPGYCGRPPHWSS